MPSTPAPQAQSIVHWYFVTRPAAILSLWKEYAAAFGALASFVFLFKTLFAPWKSIKDEYPNAGFNIAAFFETLTLNITARAIGFVIRIFAIVAGAVMQIVLAIGFLTYLIAWLIFPALLIGIFPYSVFLLFQ